MGSKFLKSRVKKQFSVLSVVLFVCLVFYTAFLFLLVYWGVLSSTKGFNFDFKLGNYGFGFPRSNKPKEYEWYSYFLNQFSFNVLINGKSHTTYLLEMFHNSFVYSLGCAFFQTIVPCLTAYVCARFKFKFLKIYPAIVIITMAIPIVGSTSSEIMMARNLGLYDQLWGMWLMKANFLGLYFLIFYTSFKSLPEAYTEAAKIDGAGNFHILFKITLPLVRNTLFTIFLIYFIQFWNDYQTPMLYIPNRPTIFFGLYKVASTQGVSGAIANICGTSALAVIGLIPTTLIFIIFNKRLLGNITVGGIK